MGNKMFLAFFIVSVIASFGTAIILVEKRYEWPVQNLNVFLRRFLQKYVHRKMHRMLKCAVCTAFWVALVVDFCLFFISDFGYFFWPFSGFAASSAVWVVMTLFEVLEKDKTNDYVDTTS